jgi:surface protein
MDSMFYECYDLKNLDISNFITDSLTNSATMFFYSKNLTNINMRNFNTENINDYDRMFTGVPTTVTITTNQATKNWIKEKFPEYNNITI